MSSFLRFGTLKRVTKRTVTVNIHQNELRTENEKYKNYHAQYITFDMLSCKAKWTL